MSKPVKTTSADDASITTQPETAAVGIKIPAFWPEDPALWFAQLEGQFALCNITSDTTKFYHAMSQLDHRYASEVRDIITNPPATGKYDKFKQQLIDRLSASQEQRTRQLLSHEELGDRKPSQFLRHLQNLAGKDVPDDFVRSLWSSRLPNHTQAIIASQAGLSLDNVAQLADKIHEVAAQPYGPQVAAASVPSPSTSSASNVLDELNRKIEDLSYQVASLSAKAFRGRNRSRPRNYGGGRRYYGRSRSTSRSEDDGLCWYHHKYRENAKHCQAPCTYNQGKGPSSH